MRMETALAHIRHLLLSSISDAMRLLALGLTFGVGMSLGDQVFDLPVREKPALIRYGFKLLRYLVVISLIGAPYIWYKISYEMDPPRSNTEIPFWLGYIRCALFLFPIFWIGYVVQKPLRKEKESQLPVR